MPCFAYTLPKGRVSLIPHKPFSLFLLPCFHYFSLLFKIPCLPISPLMIMPFTYDMSLGTQSSHSWVYIRILLLCSLRFSYQDTRFFCLLPLLLVLFSCSSESILLRSTSLWVSFIPMKAFMPETSIPPTVIRHPRVPWWKRHSSAKHSSAYLQVCFGEQSLNSVHCEAVSWSGVWEREAVGEDSLIKEHTCGHTTELAG